MIFCVVTGLGLHFPVTQRERKIEEVTSFLQWWQQAIRLRCPANVLADGAAASLADRCTHCAFASSASGSAKARGHRTLVFRWVRVFITDPIKRKSSRNEFRYDYSYWLWEPALNHDPDVLLSPYHSIADR